ncbi:MAG: cystathionine beta-lyase [Rhodospirillaceae bacterium]|nr:cystathionine beta-lyase [Rhodospirillaceae bacterium]MBT5244376.1 cystathionine beta-lyase [Rhodospirillaceae bacterium]MBT5563737.1 cystathionine beta-lyase [Rhodospirillaceae bacterium]MBT6241567.1 cystathionine beta-lyase [Rhodospirillaceae bacterium]
MKKQTRILTAGRDPEANFGIVNPPVYHASTILFPTVEALYKGAANRYEGYTYGLTATPTSKALEEAIAELEGYDQAIAVPSGLAAICAALLAFLGNGDHLLMVDSTYRPTRRFCDSMLKRFGIETTYYDPMIGAGISELMRPETKVVFTEAPGSLTFEVQDLPAICQAAHDGGAKVILDNTWSGGVYLSAPDMGVDVSVQAVTKYIGGHSDLMMGSIAMNDEDFIKIKDAACELGYGAAPDDCFLALRGIRTINARLPIHQETGLKLANWLDQRPEVDHVLHPALPSCPGHENWKRDFTGSSGLFGFVLKEEFTKTHVAAMLDDMELFAMGYSWGGFESLIVPYGTTPPRSALPWASGQLIRIHAGLEAPEDLIADLEAGFVRLNA